MDNHLLRYIGSYTRALQYLCDVKYRGLNLQKGQFMFLMRICENPGISQQELSDLIAVEKSTTTRALQKLENDGYVLRRKNPDDTRKSSVYATEKGMEIYSELARHELHLLKQLTKQLTQEEHAILTDVFSRITTALPDAITTDSKSTLTILLAKDESLMADCHAIRKEVFQVGQGVPEAIDFDGRDSASDNFLASYGGKPAGTVRLRQINDHTLKLERLAVLEEFRGLSIGSAIIEYCSVYAKTNGFDTIKLHAQMSALAIYLKAVYEIVGKPFIEADIEHVLVIKSLT